MFPDQVPSPYYRKFAANQPKTNLRLRSNTGAAALHCMLSNFAGLFCDLLLYTAVHCLILHYLTLHCSTLHCFKLNCIALSCRALHRTEGNFLSIFWSFLSLAGHILSPQRSQGKINVFRFCPDLQLLHIFLVFFFFLLLVLQV